MMFSFSHLAKGDTSLKVFSTYAHDIDQPGYIVRVAMIKNERVHYLPEHLPFRNIGDAQTFHILFVLRCRDKGYVLSSSSCI